MQTEPNAADGGVAPALPAGSLKAVIFDVDGTLADTEPEGHRVAFNRAFDEFGIDWFWTHDAYGELLKVTGGKERIRHYAASHPPELYGRIDLETWIARLHKLKSEIYASMILAGKIPLRPGVARLIRELRAAGIHLAIATTTTPSSLDSLIMAHFGHGMTEIFDVVGAGDIVPHKKPAPDIYLWALKHLELAPEDCLVVEDSLPGLAAARAAGLATIITTSAYTQHDDFAGALTVLTGLGDAKTPACHLAGLTLESPIVGVEQLRRWHGAAYPRRPAPPPHRCPNDGAAPRTH
jgi:HAD superfamily hydrolase (TIGR01509 family)